MINAMTEGIMFLPSSFAEKEKINKISVTEDKSREKMGYYSTGKKRKKQRKWHAGCLSYRTRQEK